MQGQEGKPQPRSPCVTGLDSLGMVQPHRTSFGHHPLASPAATDPPNPAPVSKKSLSPLKAPPPLFNPIRLRRDCCS